MNRIDTIHPVIRFIKNGWFIIIKPFQKSDNRLIIIIQTRRSTRRINTVYMISAFLS